MIYEIRDLVFAYPAARAPVVNYASLTVGEGEVVTLLGRNGAGKSTLLGCMLGLLKPQSGSLLLSGRDVFTMGEREIASIVGYVPQSHTPSFAYTVLDFVVMGCAPRIGLFSKPGKKERADAQRALEELGIAHLGERPYTQLSGGERQQATIARAVVSKPRAVLFDEPTAHLDFSNQMHVLRMIKRLAGMGYAVVVTTHNPDHALLLGGTAALMDGQGRLRAGETAQIVTEETLRDVYGTEVLLAHIDSLGRRACVYPNL